MCVSVCEYTSCSRISAPRSKRRCVPPTRLDSANSRTGQHNDESFSGGSSPAGFSHGAERVWNDW